MLKSYTFTIFVVALSAVLSSAMAQQAAGGTRSVAIGARVLYASAEDAFGEGASVDEEVGFGGLLKFAIAKPVWFQLGADWLKFKASGSVDDVWSVSGDLEIIPISGTFLVNLAPSGSVFQPYVGAGVGYYLNEISNLSVSILGISTEELFGMSVEDMLNVNADDAFGWHICAGLDLFLSQNVAINVEGLYRWAEYDWEISSKPMAGFLESGSDKLDGWAIVAGLSIFF